MQHRSKTATALLILGLFLIQSAPVLAAGGPPPPPGGGGTPPCWPPPCIPIDGGVSFLIIAGLALGALKIYTSQRRKTA